MAFTGSLFWRGCLLLALVAGCSSQGKVEEPPPPPPPLEETPEGETPDPPLLNTRSAGCQGETPLAEGAGSIQVAALARTYVIRLPVGYSTAKPWPLILALHPNGNEIAYWDATTGERNIRATVREKAIVVIPQGAGGLWNDDVPRDLAFFEALLAKLKAGLCIDTERIFSLGFSGGGSFSGVLGCYRTDIRAFAAGGAIIYNDYAVKADCVGRPATWITIGAQELSGREPFRDFWRARNGCTAVSTPVNPSPCVAWTCPETASPAHYCQHPDGHIWPSFGTQAVWDFFSQF